MTKPNDQKVTPTGKPVKLPANLRIVRGAGSANNKTKHINCKVTEEFKAELDACIEAAAAYGIEWNTTEMITEFLADTMKSTAAIIEGLDNGTIAIEDIR